MNLDRIKTNLAAFIRQVTGRLEYAGLQAATVIAQNGDGSLEVRFEDPKYPPLSKLKLLPPAPGCAVKVAAGARVMVGWIGCSPDMPIALAWDVGTTNELDLVAPSIKLGSSNPGDAAALASNTESRLHALELFAASHMHSGVAAGTALSGVASPAPTFSAPAVASNVVKVSG